MSIANLSSTIDEKTGVLRVSVEDSFSKVLTPLAQEVVCVRNYASELSFTVWDRENCMMSDLDFSLDTACLSK
jgi:hypothetical protein